MENKIEKPITKEPEKAIAPARAWNFPTEKQTVEADTLAEATVKIKKLTNK